MNAIDQLWKDHLLQMDHLRQGIHLRGYGQKDPKIEYKKEGFELFQIMKGRIAASVVSMVLRIEPAQQAVPQPRAQATQAPEAGTATGTALPPPPQRKSQRTIETHGEAAPPAAGAGRPNNVPVVRAGPKVQEVPHGRRRGRSGGGVGRSGARAWR